MTLYKGSKEISPIINIASSGGGEAIENNRGYQVTVNDLAKGNFVIYPSGGFDAMRQVTLDLSLVVEQISSAIDSINGEEI